MAKYPKYTTVYQMAQLTQFIFKSANYLHKYGYQVSMLFDKI